jgi:hypothetical protein
MLGIVFVTTAAIAYNMFFILVAGFNYPFMGVA